MKIKHFIGTALTAALSFSCAQDEIMIDNPTPEGEKITFKIVGEMPNENGNSTRAYMGNDRGVYWMDGDKISVFTKFTDPYGIDMLQFKAVEGSEGQKKATFTWSDFMTSKDVYFEPGTWFVACYPIMSVKPTSTDINVTQNRLCTMPPKQIQNGDNSRHLKETMVMFSGIINIPEDGMPEENGALVLPEITFKHRTAVHRFLVTNRREYPLNLKSVRMSSYQAGSETEYPAFNESVTFNMGSLEIVEKGSAPYTYREVEISQNGKPYYTLESGESVYLYVSSFYTDLKDIDLSFTVTDSEGNVYKTLAIPGTKIQNSAFEYGKCYTYDLLVDNNLTLQGWDVDYIDNVNLGQRDFVISSDKIMMSLDGNRRETITINTTDDSGWNIIEAPEWISSSATSGSKGESQITFSAQPATSEREGKICILSGNLKKYIRVIQTADTNPTDAIYLKAEDMQNEEITSYILQDDEPGDILYNTSLRSFKTTEPLQVEITSDNKLHLRFYSPRKLTDVQIWASIPNIMSEEFLLAELEEVAPFADIYTELPQFGKKDCVFTTISGKDVTFKAGPTFNVNSMKLRATSSSEYWKMLQDIKVTWTVSFRGYYAHEYTDPNHIMRGAHCREAVALALNNTYMFSTNEYRDFIFSLQGKLYTDDAGTEFVDTHSLYYDRILKGYSVQFGLTTYAGFAFMGGGGLYVPEESYLTHYADDATDKHNYVIWHEFGHTIGFYHPGNMTYPNAEEIGWSICTAEFYHNMSKAKKLPIYSRRFLHTRDTPGSSLYSNKWKVNEWHSFGTTEEEDPILFEIDGGKLWYF